MIKVKHNKYWICPYGVKYLDDVMEYLVPKSITRPSQHRSATRYVNRQLPMLNRTRGDVGVV